jgi:putative hydrolase of the HAD superfamily
VVSREIPERSAAVRTARAWNTRSIAVASSSATTIDAAALTHGPVPVSATSMAAQPRAILLDALGTLISFEPPAPHLRAALQARTGLDVGAAAAEAAMRAEIRYYRAHLDEGGDAAGLADLRRRCAAAMAPELPGVPADQVLPALLEALRFFAYPDVAPALGALRERGVRTIVVSNWDASLHERLAETGLAGLVDGALASAEVGAAKPQRAIFAAALALAGDVAPRDAWHVGDTIAADVEGARAAGLTPVLIARDGPPAAPPPGVPVIASLTELLPLALSR